MSVQTRQSLGQRLYELLYQDDPARYPRGRYPWQAVDPAGKQRFQHAAEQLCLMLIDTLGKQVNAETPTIGGVSNYFEVHEIGTWLMSVRNHVEREGEFPE